MSAVPVDIVKAVEVRESSLSLVEEDVAADVAATDEEEPELEADIPELPVLPPGIDPVSYTHLDVYKRQGYATLYVVY